MAEARSAANTTSGQPSGRLFTTPFIALGVADLAYFTAVGVAIFALPPST